MKVNVFARHGGIDNAVKDYAYTKAQKLRRYSKYIQDIKIVLDKEGEGHIAEMIVILKKEKFVSKIRDSDMHAAIDILMDKVERQLIRRKEKRKSHRLKNKRKIRFFSDMTSEEETTIRNELKR